MDEAVFLGRFSAARVGLTDGEISNTITNLTA
jgi:hypothetical protein